MNLRPLPGASELRHLGNQVSHGHWEGRQRTQGLLSPQNVQKDMQDPCLMQSVLLFDV